MPNPGILGYLLLLVAIFAHYSLGRRLGMRSLVAGSLVGLGASALAVAILAGVFAGAIRPYVCLSVFGWGALSIADLVRTRAVLGRVWKIYLVLAIAAAGLFACNDPQRVFFREEAPDRVEVLIHSHYTYYASQSTEMLRADYAGRLRVSDFYPRHWTRYHFFGAATQALTQGLQREPGLFTFFMAQTVLMILVLLAPVETLLLRFGIALPVLLGVSTWYLMGFLLFASSLRYLLVTSSAMAILAWFHLLFALYSKENAAALVWSGLLSACAIRFMPIGALAGLVIAFRFLSLRTISQWRAGIASLGFCRGTVLGLLVIYQAATLGLGAHAPHAPFFSESVFSDGWFFLLIGYRLLGHFIHLILHRSLFPLYDYLGYEGPFFDRLVGWSVSTVAFYLLALVVASLFVGRAWRRRSLGSRDARWLTALGVLGIAGAYLISRELARLHLLFFVYGAVTYFAVRAIARESDSVRDREIGWLVLGLQLVVLFFEYTGANQLKAPIATLILDLSLWALLGIYLTALRRPRALLAWASLALGLSVFLRVDTSRWLQIPFPPTTAIDVSPLMQKGFRRSNEVGTNGMASFSFADPVKEDVYAALLGARLPYREGKEQLVNHLWIE